MYPSVSPFPLLPPLDLRLVSLPRPPTTPENPVVTDPEQVPGNVALRVPFPCPPPLLLHLVSLAQHLERLAVLEGHLVGVLRRVVEHGVHDALVQDAQLLLDACETREN